MESAFLTLEELCIRYAIKPSSVYQWIKSRGLPEPLKFGRLSRWKVSDVETWEHGLQQGTTPAPAARVEAVREEMAKRRNRNVAAPVKKKQEKTGILTKTWPKDFVLMVENTLEYVAIEKWATHDWGSSPKERLWRNSIGQEV